MATPSQTAIASSGASSGLFSSTTLAATESRGLYRWRDAQGNMHFGENPPANARDIVHVSALKSAPKAKAATQAQAAEPKHAPPLKAAASESGQALDRLLGQNGVQINSDSSDLLSQVLGPVQANQAEASPLSADDFSSISDIYDPNNLEKIINYAKTIANRISQRTLELNEYADELSKE